MWWMCASPPRLGGVTVDGWGGRWRAERQAGDDEDQVEQEGGGPGGGQGDGEGWQGGGGHVVGVVGGALGLDGWCGGWSGKSEEGKFFHVPFLSDSRRMNWNSNGNSLKLFHIYNFK